MDLYLVRHAIAVERGTEGFNRDSDRPLTEKGIKKMKGVAKAMKNMGVSFDLLLSSPFRRAKETAEIIGDEFECRKSIKFSPHLAVGGSPRELIDEINHDYPDVGDIMLVGHEPYLSTLISMLVSGHDGIPVRMKKGGACKLSIETLSFRRCAELEWLMGPAQFLKEE